MSESTEVQLTHLLELSKALDEDLDRLLRKCQARPSKRAAISMALCHAAFEHAVSQRFLLEAGLSGTALALCRLHFEAVVRAAWVNQGASEEWIDKFTTPVEGESTEHREPVIGPPIPAMLDAFARHAPHVAAELGRLNGTIKAMHSFVHGGAQAVVHALRPYPADKLIGVLWNRNLLQLYLANAAVMAVQDPGLLPRMRLLREKHAGCMPPASS